MRTFAKCYPTQKWQIFRHYEPDIHFFISCCDDPQADGAKRLYVDYGNENVHIEHYQDPTDLPVIPDEFGTFAPYANATTHAKLMLQHWGNKKVWDFFCASADRESFDVIIRIRPDLWIHRFTRPDHYIIDLYHIDSPWPKTVLTPWWGKFGGVNDRLAIMGRLAAPIYFNMFDSIHSHLSLGCPFHPETLLAETLSLNARAGKVIVRNTLLTEFSTERMDGSRRWAEIVTSDMVEFIAATR